MSAIVY